MRNRRIVLQALVSMVLVVGLILPASLVGASVARQQPDDHSLPHLVIDTWSDAPALAVNTPQGQVTPMVAAGRYHTVGLKSDGTVVAAGWNYYGQCDVGGWTDIIQVAAGEGSTVGLKSDGTVVFTFTATEPYIEDWTEIVQLGLAQGHIVGLRSDGTVVAEGDNYYGQCDVEGWTDIIQVAAGGYFHTAGDITAPLFEGHTVGLGVNGTVIAVGFNSHGQCDVNEWTDIVQVAAGDYHTVGLRFDRTVVQRGYPSLSEWVGNWTDIVQVAAGDWHIVGLRSDGTVMAVGSNYAGQCDVGGWTDIVQVAAGDSHTVGLGFDGTVVSTGSNLAGDVSDWNLGETSVAIQIWDWHDLDAVRSNLDGSYILMNDLDASTAGYEELASSTANGGMGWEPLGTPDDPFAGGFDGQGYEIRSLFINRPDEDFVGLFGGAGVVSTWAGIRNTSVVNVSVLGNDSVGGLAGATTGDGAIVDCNSTGIIAGNQTVGGLVGRNSWDVDNSSFSGTVSGVRLVGGLIGYSIADGHEGYGYARVTDCYSAGTVMGGVAVGGLVGLQHVPGPDEDVGGLSGINRSASFSFHSNRGVTGDEVVGDPVGSNYGGLASANSCYSTSDVTGDTAVGGLVGVSNTVVADSYASGSVTGDSYVGGLVGYSYGLGYKLMDVVNSYSTGNVTGDTHIGGLVGYSEIGGVTNSFWDMETSGMTESDGGTGKTTAEMKDIATWLDAGWSIAAVLYGEIDPDYTWNIVDGQTYPFLNWERMVGMHEIWDWYDLDAIRYNLGGYYVLMNDLDSATPDYDDLAGPDANDGKGWEPIGTLDDPFTGSFDGQGYEIRSLFISRPEEDFVGLFGGAGVRFAWAGIRNTSVVNVSVLGNDCVGGLAGLATGEGAIVDCNSTGIIEGHQGVGGLVGWNSWDVSNSTFSGTVSGVGFVGGLIGYNIGPGSAFARVTNCYSAGTVMGEGAVGGLVGLQRVPHDVPGHSTNSVTDEDVGGSNGISRSTLLSSYSAWAVNSYGVVGDLVGSSYGLASVYSCYSTSDVTGDTYVGGLVGVSDSFVVDSYARGSVIGDSHVGGLVGLNYIGDVVNSYSTGNVIGDTHIGGLVGWNDEEGDVRGSFWDVETSGTTESDGGTGKTTAEMQSIATFLAAEWPIVAVRSGGIDPGYTWNIVDGQTYPFLSWELMLSGAPIARASDISGRPKVMYPDEPFTVTAEYFDPDGREDLKYCYLQLRHPEKPLTMMWDQATDDFWMWAGEEGENYLTTVSGNATPITEGGLEGYQLAWTFTINDQWPEVENAIDFGVYARDEADSTSGWDYDHASASFCHALPIADPAKSVVLAVPHPAHIPADGITACAVEVLLFDSNYNPVPGKLVNIVTDPWVIVEQPPLPTDKDGRTTARLRSLRAGTADVAAVDVTDNVELETHVSVVFGKVWYALDGHVHTTYSRIDGQASVYEQANEANRRNNDLVIGNDIDAMIITDHGPMLAMPPVLDAETAWIYLAMECRDAGQGNDPLVIPGEELGGSAKYPGGGTGHYLAYGIGRHISHDPFIKLQSQIDAVETANGFGFIAHPYAGPDICPGDLLDYSGFAGIELLNGDETTAGANTVIAWHRLMSNHLDNIRRGEPGNEGRQGWVGLGNSDAHCTADLGRNKNYVYVDGGLTEGNLYSSLKQGRVVATHGPMVTLEISLLGTNGEQIGNPTKMGELLWARAGQNAMLHIAWDTMGCGDLEGIYLAGSLSPRPCGQRIGDAEGNLGYIDYPYDLTASGYLRVEARLKDGSGSAYTNPVFVHALGPSPKFYLFAEAPLLVGPSEVMQEEVEIVASWADAIFWIDWGGSTVGLTLVDPNGLVITPSSHPASVCHEAGPTYAFYQIVEPVPGTWIIKMEGIDVPSGGENVNLQIWSTISTKPMVEILQPAHGASVSGRVDIAVNATDAEGISELACYVDGISLGTGINAPYEFSWDSTTVEDGAHLITVWVTDVEGNTVGDSAEVYVVNHPELQPTARAGEDTWAMLGETIVFDGSASEGQPGVSYSYVWHFGNDDSALGQTVEYAYNSPGTYTATLWMWDEKGNHSTDDLVVVVQIPAIIDFDPNVLSLRARGRVVTVYIELPEGFDVHDIDISSIRLNGTVPALSRPTSIGDYNRNGIPDLMVMFDRSAVHQVVEVGESVEITITGQVDGIPFMGVDTIRVIGP